MGTNQNTAAIYVRRSAVDTENKQSDAFSRSLQAQERECRAFAERQGLSVVEVYRDKTGTSASHLTTNRRPEMERAMSEIGGRFKTLIVWAFDRATRKGIAEAGAILDTVEKADGRLVSVTDGVDTNDETARLMIAIRAEMARDEMTKLSTRTRRGKDEQRRRGEYLGGSLPYGLLRDPNAEFGVVVDEAAAEVIREAVDVLLAGASLKEACATMNDKGHLTTSGATWSASTLRRTIQSPHMLGHRRYGDDLYRDDDGNPVIVSEPILTEGKFRRVQKAVAARAKSTGNLQRGQHTLKRHSSLLGGLTRCAHCKCTMSSNSIVKQSTGVVYRHYRCQVCSRHAIGEQMLDDHVARTALLFLASLDPESQIVEEVGRRWMARFSPEQLGRHAAIRDELDAIEGRHRELQTAYFDRGTMDTDVFERLDRKMAAQIADLRDEMRDTPTPQADLTALFDLAQSSDDPAGDSVGEGSAWKMLPDHERREIMRVLVEAVTVERSDDRNDIAGRVTVELATESNVIDLANRSERITGKHINRAVKTA